MLEDYALVIEHNIVRVAEQDSRVVGVVVLITDMAEILLDNIAVDPLYQGRGIGRKLIEYAEQYAAANGFSGLNLYTHESMTENIEMYSKLGYLETDRRCESGYDRVYMRKEFKKNHPFG